ncbi:MAG TPA: hypothetical protein VKU86_06670 [Acidimicrobiales bacterium]|nr:hypothetical protein [Acidimicrobiales bacterium]
MLADNLGVGDDNLPFGHDLGLYVGLRYFVGLSDRLDKDRLDKDRLDGDCLEMHLQRRVHGLFGHGLFGHGFFGDGFFGDGLFGDGLFGDGLFGDGLFGDRGLRGLVRVRLVPEGVEHRAGVVGRVPGHVVDTGQEEQAGRVHRLAMTLPGFVERLSQLLRCRQREQPGDPERFVRGRHASAAKRRSTHHQVGRVPLGVVEVEIVRGRVFRFRVLIGDPQ